MVLLLSITNSCLKQDVNKAEPQLSERLTQFMGVGDQQGNKERFNPD
jgi:hypothetical protein